ncbi:MAG: zinc-ribbon domain-containing protein [Bacilli bacterium]|jgi:hypothetical protein
MAKCRNCGARVYQNASICPVCGTDNPVKTKKVRTVDITLTLDPVNPDYHEYKRKSKLVCGLLFCFVGFSGAGYFYINDVSKGLSWLIGHLIFIGAGIGFGYLLGNTQGIVTAAIILACIVFILNLVFGFIYIFRSDVKDGNGEFLE